MTARLTTLPDEPSPNSHVIHMLVLDIEVTGWDHEVDELIGLAMTKVEVNRSNGAFIRVMDEFDGLQEPTAELSDQAVQILGYDRSALVGHQLDVQRITELVDSCELVVAHDARFDRPFLEKLVPAFRHRQWVCSMNDIYWEHLQVENLAWVDHLALCVGHHMPDSSPKSTVEAMVKLLSHPWEENLGTGFGVFIELTEGPFLKFFIPDRSGKLTFPIEMYGLRYSKKDRGWTAILGGTAAEVFQDALVDMGVFDGRIKRFHIQQLDPVLRFSTAPGGY